MINLSACKNSARGVLVKRLDLPGNKSFSDFWFSPDFKKALFKEEASRSGGKVGADIVYFYDIEAKDTVRIINPKENSDFYVDEVKWTPDGANVLIVGLSEERSTIYYSYFFDAKKRKLTKLASVQDTPNNSSQNRNKYFFLSGAYHTFPYSTSLFFVTEAGLGEINQKNYLLDIKSGKKQTIPFNQSKKTRGFINSAIFSKDGSLIIFEANPPFKEYDSKGLWVYDIKQENLNYLESTSAKMKTVMPLALSNDKRWLLYYFAPSHYDYPPEEDKEKRPVYVYDLNKTQLIRSNLKLTYSETWNVSWLNDNLHFLVLKKEGIFKYKLDDLF